MDYPILLIKEDEGYTAMIPDLKGCITQGDTLDEAIEMIQDAKESWLEVARAYGDDIPKAGACLDKL